jgi:hypothetical protein
LDDLADNVYFAVDEGAVNSREVPSFTKNQIGQKKMMNKFVFSIMLVTFEGNYVLLQVWSPGDTDEYPKNMMEYFRYRLLFT